VAALNSRLVKPSTVTVAALIIRPDQYVAWRGNNPTDTNRLFAQVVGRTT
jgi:hypothetical protein